jgi:LPXTG-site transpeptidase (sortase) family protein
MAVKGMTLDDVRVIRIPWRRILLGVGLAFGFVAAGFIVTNTYATLWQQRLEERWGALVTAGVAVDPRVGEPVAKLVIPRLDLERVILEGTERSVLRKAPAHVPGSPLPGEEGNAVIRGHRLLWSGPFRDLDELGLGTEIHVQTLSGTSVYLVAGVFRQEGRRVDLFEDTSLPYLTLVTSDPPLRADGSLVVRAALVERNGVPV